MPVKHGCNSKGGYGSSAFFIRLDDSDQNQSREATTPTPTSTEFLFWGDVESGLGVGKGTHGDVKGKDLNREVWREAAVRWEEGRLGGVFVSVLS